MNVSPCGCNSTRLIIFCIFGGWGGLLLLSPSSTHCAGLLSQCYAFCYHDHTGIKIKISSFLVNVLKRAAFTFNIHVFVFFFPIFAMTARSIDSTENCLSSKQDNWFWIQMCNLSVTCSYDCTRSSQPSCCQIIAPLAATLTVSGMIQNMYLFTISLSEMRLCFLWYPVVKINNVVYQRYQMNNSLSWARLKLFLWY